MYCTCIHVCVTVHAASQIGPDESTLMAETPQRENCDEATIDDDDDDDEDEAM